jgi:hypothetical protein
MTYEITKEQLDGTFEQMTIIEAASPAEALQLAGYKPDKEDSSFSGAEPRNEYGRPWYPHYMALEI